MAHIGKITVSYTHLDVYKRQNENKVGRSHFNACRRIESEHQLEEVGKELRKMYSWNDEK